MGLVYESGPEVRGRGYDRLVFVKISSHAFLGRRQFYVRTLPRVGRYSLGTKAGKQDLWLNLTIRKQRIDDNERHFNTRKIIRLKISLVLERRGWSRLVGTKSPKAVEVEHLPIL